jgi:DNA-binding transcriptional regulator GbsR (MarR family)
MAYLDSKDKRLVRDYIHKWVNAGGDKEVTVGNYQRTVQWSEGMTMAEIAESEGVSKSAVSVSIINVVLRIKAFAESNDKE